MAILTREERQAVLIQAAGSPEAWNAYLSAGAALHDLARSVPGSLGRDVADVYKEMTARLEAALAVKGDQP